MSLIDVNKSACRARLNAYKQAYLGLSELSYVLGVSRQVLANWRRRKAPLPPLAADLAMGPIWARDDVWEWLEKR